MKNTILNIVIILAFGALAFAAGSMYQSFTSTLTIIKNDLEERNTKINSLIDEGYKIIAVLEDSKFYPPLEKCTDKEDVLYLNFYAEKTKSIGKTKYVMCK